MSRDHNYEEFWIEYTNGEIYMFLAERTSDAERYFHNEGDHALEWGAWPPPLDKRDRVMTGGVSYEDAFEA